MKKYEFKNSGRDFSIYTPKTVRNWSNYLFNSGYYTEISQTLQGKSLCLDPIEREITRSNRFFYIKDKTNGIIFSANYAPLKSEYDRFECTHSQVYTELITEMHGIESKIKMFVPVDGYCELYSWEVQCLDGDRELELYTALFPEYTGMGITCEYSDRIFSSYMFPYHIKYEEHEFVKTHKNYIFCIANRKADRFIGSELLFYGCEDRSEIPAFIADEKTPSQNAYGDTPAIFACGYNASLHKGEKYVLNMVLGAAATKEEINQYKDKPDLFNEELKKSEDRYNAQANNAVIETPDEDINTMLNYWIKKQTLCMSQTHRKTVFVCTRNELQDAVGLSVLNPDEGKAQILRAFAEQYVTGYLQQHHTYNDVVPPRGLGTLKHMDGVVWLVLCGCFVMNQLGSNELLDETVRYKKSEVSETVYRHIMRGIDFMHGNKGIHGLSLLGDGDWTDPINGAGRLGKGESTWTSMAFVAALKEFLPFAQESDKEKIKKEIGLLDEAINKHSWEYDRYVAGFDDNGIPFGSKTSEEGKIYLNPQTWAIISGVARGERLEKCKAAIKGLETPFGCKLLAPAYSKWDAQVGKISIKTAGTTENGSVYNHASMFKAYADYICNDTDAAYETIMSVLPTNKNNPPENSLQVPLFVSNFYHGIEGPSFGKSSNVNYTGTCAWMLWLTVNYTLGAKATVNGLVLNPNLPSGWTKAGIKRRYKNAVYDIEIVTGTKRAIYVDGELYNNEFLPYASGRTYKVLAVC